MGMRGEYAFGIAGMLILWQLLDSDDASFKVGGDWIGKSMDSYVRVICYSYTVEMILRSSWFLEGCSTWNIVGYAGLTVIFKLSLGWNAGQTFKVPSKNHPWWLIRHRIQRYYAQ